MRYQDDIAIQLEAQFVEHSARYVECIASNIHQEVDLTNVFGKRVKHVSNKNISELAGMALTGLRCAAFLNGLQLETQLSTIAFLKENRVAGTIFLESNFNALIPQLAVGHTIILTLSNSTDLSHILLLAQGMAEKAMCPVFILNQTQKFDAPTASISAPLVRQFLGEPNAFIDSETRLEQLIFGKKRKPVPEWQNLDLPISSNINKNEFYKGLQSASEAEYLLPLINKSIASRAKDYEKLTGWTFEPSISIGSHRAKYAFVLPFISVQNEQEVKEISKGSGKDILAIQYNVLYPFSAKAIDGFKNLKAVAALDQVLQTQWLSSQIAINAENAIGIHSIIYDNKPENESLIPAGSYLINQRNSRSKIYLDVHFSKSSSPYSKHEMYLQRLKRDFPESLNKSLLANRNNGHIDNQPLPKLASELKDEGPNYAKVNRFFQDTVLFHNDNDNQNIAEPFQALPISATGSAAFKKSEKLEKSPHLNLSKCTACLKCTADCPHMAMPSALFTYNELVKQGIQNARKQGTPVITFPKIINSFVKNLSKATSLLRKDKRLSTLDKIIDSALVNQLMDETDGELAKRYRQEIDVMFGELRQLQVAFSEKQYWDAESREEGSGHIFSLAINSLACTACGICAERCAEEAIYLEGKEQDSNQFNLMQLLPDTAGDKICELVEDAEIDPFAALYLSPYYYESIVGEQCHEGWNQQRVAIHGFTALTEEIMQSRSAVSIQKIDGLISSISDLVKKQLSTALPTAKLDSLNHVINNASSDFLSMDKILADWGNEESFKMVNRKDLQNTLILIEDLIRLKDIIATGPTGMGRSRYSVVLGSGCEFLAKYPFNAFKVPVVNGAGNELKLAKGLFEGHLRQVLDNIRLLRRAELVAKKKYDPSKHNADIAKLNWNGLSQEERHLVPPVYIIANQQFIDTQLDEFISTLNLNNPIKCLLFNNISPNKTSLISGIVKSTYPFLMAASNGKNYVSRTFVSNKKAFYNSAVKLIKQDHSAVLELCIADLAEMEINASRWPELYGLALNCRALVEYKFDPEKPGKSLGEKLDTSNNPDFKNTWTTTELQYKTGDEVKTINYTITWADWAFLHKGLKKHFSLLNASEDHKQVADFVGEGIPVIKRINSEGKLVHYQVDDVILEAVWHVKSSVQMIRELSGLYSKHPEKLKKLVEKELSIKYEKAQKELEATYETQKQEWKNEHLDELKSEITGRLVELSKMAD